MNKPAPKTIKPNPIRAIRRAAVPLCAFETADPAATIKAICETVKAERQVAPTMQWDIINGLTGINQQGVNAAAAIAPGGPIESGNPAECLRLLAQEKTPKDSLVFFHNAHRLLADPAFVQGVWNLRDLWKATASTLVLLLPSAQLPAELQHDVVVITEPLPDAAEVGAIVEQTCRDANVEVEDQDKVVDVLLGVSAFAAEQALAMSITKDGIDRDGLWERKRKMVEQTPGLSIWRDRVSFDDVGGLGNIKDYLTKLLTSENNPVRCIGFIDEIEKMFAGTAGDLSGVSADQLRVFLTEMQDANVPGIILVGPPGTGKSLISKCAATVCDGETVAIDTGAMTGSLVGQSQGMIRKAMATFRAVSQGKGLFIATCNKIASLPPELRRRFKLGTFYVDLPSAPERESIWKVKLAKFGFTGPKTKRAFDDEGWTGAEIEACVDVAWRCGVSLDEASKFVVPVSKSAADQIQALRTMASGKFISANEPGIYQYNPQATAPTGRRIKND